MKWVAWLLPTEGDNLRLGVVEAETLDQAMQLAKLLILGALPPGSALCLMEPRAPKPSQHDRQNALFKSRLWRAADTRRVSGHIAKKRTKGRLRLSARR